MIIAALTTKMPNMAVVAGYCDMNALVLKDKHTFTARGILVNESLVPETHWIRKD